VSERRAAAAVAAHLERGRPVSRGGGRAPVLALTFDDGPDVHGRMLVDLLRRAGAPATFFDVGERAALRPDVIRAQSVVGEVGSHSLDHALLTRLPEPAVRANLASASGLLRDAGAGTVRLFRPPYGASGGAIAAAAASVGLLQVLYSVDSDDWREHDSEGVLRNVLPGLRPGAIVLLHEVCAHTVQAVPDIVAAARRRGLRLVTVPELLALDPPRSRVMVRAQRWGDHRRMTRARAAHARDGGWDTRSMAVPQR
jgi:peptidoglycan/xylan/chitin deacetylase (PgdA/CDA1 family)